MKKLFSLILVLTMVLSLCACSNSGSGSPETTAPKAADGLQVGFASINITPDYSVGLGGYSDDDTRRSEGFVQYIYLFCVAVRSGDETILMFEQDKCGISQTDIDSMRESVTAATGIAADKIFVGGTHGHSCPSYTSDANGKKYRQFVMDSAAEAAKAAIADLAPATMQVAMPTIEKMTFVRHYLMMDGTYAGSNFGDFSKGIVDHAREADCRMILLKFDRPEEKQDILMVNWQGHPDSGSEIGYNLISPSWIGPMREKLAKDSGMLVAYFSGASGDQNIRSQIQEENPYSTYIKYGEDLANIAFSHLGELQPVGGTEIKTHQVQFDAEVDHSWDHMLEQANEVFDLWKSAGKSAGDALGKQYNFTSSYQARAIRNRAKMAATRRLELNAFSIGEVGFITGTMEMFSTTSKYVRENAPFGTTFVITSSGMGYIPCKEAYDYRSYEADTSFYAKGTAEKLAELYVEMLNKIS